MARRFRRRKSRGTGRKARRIRWVDASWQFRVNLEADLGTGVEWASFWAKWPASMAALSRSIPPGEEEIATNEPVDETLVRTISYLQSLVTNPGTGGVPNEPVNFCFGLIPFDGGEYPSFFDFAVFQEGVSLVAPPHPIFQADDDWIIRNPIVLASELQVLDTGDGSELNIQSRAMRKLPAGKGILAVIGVVSLLTAASQVVTFDGGGDIRMAVKSGFSI